MSERIERMLGEALQNKRPVLVNPTEDQIRLAAESLLKEGKLICTSCRRPIEIPDFRTRRISFGPRLQAVAHLHPDCESPFLEAMAEGETAFQSGPAASESASDEG